MNHKGVIDAGLILIGLIWVFSGVLTHNWYELVGSFILFYVEKDTFFISSNKN